MLPIDLTAVDGVVTPSAAAASVLVHISTSPWDWNNNDIVHQCDSMNYVFDAAHAERYERIVSRRGVLLTIEQTAMFVKATGDERMWNPDWPAATIDPKAVIFGMKQLGVDVSPWTGERSPVPS